MFGYLFHFVSTKSITYIGYKLKFLVLDCWDGSESTCIFNVFNKINDQKTENNYQVAVRRTKLITKNQFEKNSHECCMETENVSYVQK